MWDMDRTAGCAASVENIHSINVVWSSTVDFATRHFDMSSMNAPADAPVIGAQNSAAKATSDRTRMEPPLGVIAVLFQKPPSDAKRAGANTGPFVVLELGGRVALRYA